MDQGTIETINTSYKSVVQNLKYHQANTVTAVHNKFVAFLDAPFEIEVLKV